MKLKYLFVFSFFIMILTVATVSANENITDDITQSQDSEILENTVSGNTFADIQNTISSASEGSVIELDGKYTGSNSPITISKQITIEGNGATLDGAKKTSIMNINSKSLTLKNIKFINSKGTAITSKGCDLTIINCTFENNGGERKYDSIEQLYYVSGCEFGAINAQKGKFTLINSTFSNNLGDDCYSVSASNCDVYFENDTFTNHKFEQMSGRDIIVGLENAKSQLINCTFKDNTVDAIYTDSYSKIKNCLFENNRQAVISFGYLEETNSNVTLDILDSTFKNNNGFSVSQFWYGLLNINWCKFVENTDTSIESRSTVNINNSEFIKNNAKNGGALSTTGHVIIQNSKFSDNSATLGGTFYSNSYWDENERYNTSLKITNSTITNSLSTSNGGAIYASLCDVILVNTNITTQKSSKGSQIYIEVGKFSSTNSSHDAVQRIDKIKARLIDVNPLTTTFDSGKNFYVGVVQYQKNDEGAYIWMSNTKVMFKVYTGNKYKIYYYKPNSQSSDPKFKIDSSLSVGKHKVEIIADGKYFTFAKKTTTITIKKAKTIVKAPKVTAKYKKSKYFKITIKNKASKKIVPKLKIKVKVYTGKKFKKFIVKTDKKGDCKINTKNLKRGTHKVKITSKNSNYEVSKTSKIIIK